PRTLPPKNPQSDESHQLAQHSGEGKSVEDYYKNLNFPKNQELFTPKVLNRHPEIPHHFLPNQFINPPPQPKLPSYNPPTQPSSHPPHISLNDPSLQPPYNPPLQSLYNLPLLSNYFPTHP
ncbi:hypothetical protein GcM1_210014, partial [Golovinomyces cichoracearum]